jgi:acyl-CoA reductase-like NAD-dependent aldehyde dehydrogenase
VITETPSADRPRTVRPTVANLLVNGEWITSEDWSEIRSPYSGEIVGRVPQVGRDVALRAVASAAAAMEDPLPAWRRAEILDRTSALITERREALAQLLVDETGKPIKAARLELERASFTYRLSADAARSLTGGGVPIDASPAGEGKIGMLMRLPIGVVAAITPFNFPANLVAHKLAPALAAGCAVVLKPAPQTPLSAIALAELESEAGLPPGWLNVLCGPEAEIGDVLLEDPRVAMITFTGSAAVGWMLRERAPRKHVALELGNATPVIVQADADLDLAAERIARTAFAFSGQACTSVQRIYVQREAEQPFLERFLPRVAALTVGDPHDESTDVGPVIDSAAQDRITSWIDEAMSEGARVLHGGEVVDGLLAPTVLGGARNEMRVCREEVFGPLVSVVTYETLEEAITLSNATVFGLQAGIFTRDLGSAFTAAARLEFGGVIVNDSPSWRVDQMPYGGVKASGVGKEGPAAAAREMTLERLVVIDAG